MDVAVNLVESYLRFNGYLTLSEMEVQKKSKNGSWETLTDVDIVGIRFPGALYAADNHDEEEARMLLISDPVLELQDDVIDVIVGEVKQGEAIFNPGLTNHVVLHSVLQRFDWLFADQLEKVVQELQTSGIAYCPMRGGGGTVRVRLVAFGRSPESDLHTISLSHIFETMMEFMDRFDDVFKPAQFKEPAPALLRLLTKIGYSIERHGGD